MLTFYHGTSKNHLPNIMRDGLRPNASLGADQWAEANDRAMFDEAVFKDSAGFVFLTKKKYVARWFAEMAAKENASEPLVLCVKLPKEENIEPDIHSEPFEGFNPMAAYRHPGPIDPKAITVASIEGIPVAPLPGEGYEGYESFSR